MGAGVLGLSCAVRLREAGYDAHVFARDLPLETTSAVAAALWYPYRAYPREHVTRWSRVTYEQLHNLALTTPASGVRMRSGIELVPRADADPWWRGALPPHVTLQPVEWPVASHPAGWRLEVPVIDMSRYLPWLVARLESLGGTVTRRWLPALPTGVVVNCTGLSSGALCDDPTVRPVRGQVVYVKQFGLETWWLDQRDEERLTYVVPREHDVVVGGTADVGSFDVRPDPETATRILDRAVLLEPRLKHARALGHRVGLRPARPRVRLERETHDEGVVVHCYGHGGAGVTLSWGCADDVVAEVQACAVPQ